MEANSNQKLREALMQIRDSVYIDPDDNKCHSAIDASDLREICDAALAAPPEPIGNGAKMLEALGAVIKVGYPHNFQREAPHIRGYCYEITKAIEKCFAALSAPPRNCDLLANAQKALDAIHDDRCYVQNPIDERKLTVKWLFAEARGECNEGKQQSEDA